MITCLGLIVGELMSANRTDLAQQCLDWLVENCQHLMDTKPTFEVNNIPYLTLKDYTVEMNEVYGYFSYIDGQVIVVKNDSTRRV